MPQSARQDYFHLLAEPLLMLEQLLMNLKVDWVQLALRTLRPPLLGQEAGLGPADVDRLLDQYACKALDFPYAPRERSRSGEAWLGPSVCHRTNTRLREVTLRPSTLYLLI